MSESSSRPLSRLPLLVLAGIAEALCPHCTEDPEFSPWRTPVHCNSGRAALSNTRALANLAATCRELYSIVNPVLYHQAQCYPERQVSLLRTLVGRADLARRVKVLRLDFDFGSVEAKDDIDRAFLLDVVARYGLTPYLECAPSPPRAGPDGKIDRVNVDLPSNLLIATCPNLEQLSTCLGYGFDFALLQPATLPHLRDVCLTHTDSDSGTHLLGLEELCLAAPNLSTLTSHMTASVGESILPLRNLRHVRLEWSMIKAGCLRTLLQSCPQLESFAYEVGGLTDAYDQFRAINLVKLLVRYVPRLKRLDLDFGNDNEVSEWDNYEGEADDPTPAPGFSSLSHLETLVVDPAVLGDWEKQSPVATLFPQSLQALTVITNTVPAKLMDEELTAFASTAYTHLPNLRSIATQDWDGHCSGNLLV
jgi:hypothetical protein